jgi:hypothetical protein
MSAPSVPAPAPRPWIGGAAAIAVALGLFFAPAAFTSRQFLYRDNGRMHAPVKRWLADELRSGHLPQWNPYYGLGTPTVAGAVDQAQHPFNLLLLVFPFEVAFKLWTLLSYALAAAGGWFWARTLSCSPAAALVAGLGFALSGSLVSASDNLTYLSAAAALPWVLGAAQAWVRRGGAGRLALLGAASGLCAAAGDPQGWGFAVLLVPLQALALADRGARPAALRRGLGAATAAVVAAAPFVLPVVLWLPESSRALPLTDRERLGWNLLPWRLAELAVPHLLRYPQGGFESPLYRAYAQDPAGHIPWAQSIYAGASVAALALLGAARDRRARWLLLGALAFGWMAMGPRAGFGQLAAHLPVLGGFRFWEKLAVWTGLFLPLAAAFGLDALGGGDRSARRLARGASAAAAVFLALLALLHLFPESAQALLAPRTGQVAPARLLAQNLSEGLLHAAVLLLALALLGAAVERGRVARAGALALVVVLADLLGANVRGYVLSPPEILRPRSPVGEFLAGQPGQQRLVTPFKMNVGRWPELTEQENAWLWGGHTLDPSFNMPWHVANFHGYSGILTRRFKQLAVRAGDRVLPMAGLWGFGWVVVPGGLGNAPASGLPPPWDVALEVPSLPVLLLRVPHRPRAYLAGELASAGTDAALEFALDPRSPGGAGTVLEGPVPPDYVPPAGTARVAADRGERVEVEVVADRRALLVLNDAFAPGWTATVDGRPAAILAANYLARGVWVEAGAHRVAFAYRTPGLREGWGLCAAGCALLGGAALWRRRRPAPGGAP